MNAIASIYTTNPFGVSEDCAQFTIDTPSTPFILHNIMVQGQEYTFSSWISSNENGHVTIGGTGIDTSSEWTRFIVTFTATGVNLPIIFGTVGIYNIYHAQLELGNVATDWTPAIEDTEARVDLVETEIQKDISLLRVDTDNITAAVESTQTNVSKLSDSITTDIQTLTNKVEAAMTSEAVEIKIKNEIENGVNKVVTTTGYTLDDNGLEVSRSDSEMKTIISDNGMTVYKNDKATLTANNAGVDAVNLHATTYLIIGKNSRFEDWGSRTACFWIGD